MSNSTYLEFVNCRARFQRLSDQSVASAWVLSLSSTQLNLRFDEPIDSPVGEKYLFQLAGLESDAYCIATLTQTGYPQHETVALGSSARLVQIGFEQAMFELISPIQFRKSQQTPRKFMTDVSASFVYEGVAHEAIVTDASSTGVGILSLQELVQGDVIQVTLKNRQFNEEFFAEVRHCRADSKLPGAYRVGMLFKEVDRVAASNWRRLIDPL